MSRSEIIQQKLDSLFRKVTTQVVFIDDIHEDIARTWFEEGCLIALEEFATKENITKMINLSIKWSDEILQNPTEEYCGEKGRIKYIQEHWHDE